MPPQHKYQRIEQFLLREYGTRMQQATPYAAAGSFEGLPSR